MNTQNPSLTDKLDLFRLQVEAADAEAAEFKARAKSAAEAARACADQAARARAGALALLVAHSTGGDSRVESESHTYWLATTTSVQGPADGADWPIAYRTRSVVLKPSKAAAKTALLLGETIEGVELVATTGIRWR